MQQISSELIAQVLELYKPETRVLKSACLEFSLVYGDFAVPSCFYSSSQWGHVTDIEIQLCLNQLAYVGAAEIVRQRLIPELSRMDFFGLQRENMLVVESRKRFRRQISTQREIKGEIMFKRWKKVGGLFLVYSDFQFEARSCFGKLELAISSSLNSAT